MEQVQDLYVINVEGIENVGKTTLLNHIKKNEAKKSNDFVDAKYSDQCEA